MVIAEAVRFTIHKRRSRKLFKMVGVAAFIGGVINTIYYVVLMIPYFTNEGVNVSTVGMSLLSLIWPVIYAVIVATTSYYRLSGIQLR